MRGEQRRDVSTGMGHQEIVTSTTPWLGSANSAKPDGDISTTPGTPLVHGHRRCTSCWPRWRHWSPSRRSRTGGWGWRTSPAGAAAYHVAWPCSRRSSARARARSPWPGATVGAASQRGHLLGGGGAGAVVVVVSAAAAVGGAAGVVIVVDVVVASWDRLRSAPAVKATPRRRRPPTASGRGPM